MADPVITPALIGAGIGAATSDSPIEGALMGGVLGGAGGAFFAPSGSLGGLSAAGKTGALGFADATAGAAMPSTIGGGSSLFGNLGSSALGGTMAGMESLSMGAPGLLGLEGAGAASLAPEMAAAQMPWHQKMMAGFKDTVSSLPDLNDNKMFQVGSQMMGQDQQQQQSPVVAPAAPPQMPQRQPQSFANTYPYGSNPSSTGPLSISTTSQYIRPRGF